MVLSFARRSAQPEATISPQIAEWHSVYAALDKAQAIIEFSLDGKILHANQNFLNTVGYTLEEIRGRHHSIFVETAHRDTPEYRLFWERLRRGVHDAGQYRRAAKVENFSGFKPTTALF